MNFKEEFLHFLWKNQIFEARNLITYQGQEVRIKNPGIYNLNAGPDFLNAHITIQDQDWYGHIEIHKHASDWYAHKHQDDANYLPVILHVVYLQDLEIEDVLLKRIPHIELKGRIPLKYFTNYDYFYNQMRKYPCLGQLHHISDVSKRLWLNRMTIERLETRKKKIETLYNQCQSDWNQLSFILIARYFGMKVNNQSFEQLALRIPYANLLKIRNQALSVEALLFGLAGLLNQNFSDEFPNRLKKEYEHLKKRFSIPEMHFIEWKTMRMRPSNFPTIRLSQLAHFITKSQNIFSDILCLQTISEMHDYLKFQASKYWSNHHLFDHESSTTRLKNTGRPFRKNIILNAILPLLFCYGKYVEKTDLVDRSLKLYEELDPEKNSISRKWRSIGLKLSSAADTQAVLHMDQNYCANLKCLNCAIGYRLLKRIQD